jgi:hypothetical protein
VIHHLDPKGGRILFFAGQLVKRFLRLPPCYPVFFQKAARFS